MPLQPGSSIGPYFIDREIGRGGMGVVYLARELRVITNFDSVIDAAMGSDAKSAIPPSLMNCFEGPGQCPNSL